MMIIICWIQALIIAILQLPFVIIGLFIIPIALLFRDKDPQEPHVLISLPKWAWWWGNDWDGAMGDDNLRYWNRDAPNFSPFWKMWYWLAIRKPINNLERNYFSCDVSKTKPVLVAGQYHVRDKTGQEGWQLVRAGWKLGFYHVIRIDDKTAYVCRVGFKIEPKHAAEDWTLKPRSALKGCTLRPYLKQRA